MKALLTVTLAVLLIGGASAQWNDCDNIPYSPGFYLQGYPAFATATKGYDADGNSVDWGGTWGSFGFCINPVYYGMLGENRWAFGAYVPFNSYSPTGGGSQSGIGDIQVSAAYWVIDDHKNGKYFSVWFWSDLPIGDDDKGLGTGQINLRPGIGWGMEKFPYQIQTSVYYNLRMKGTYTVLGTEIDIKPGNEIWALASFGYGVNEQIMPALEIETGWGVDSKINDVTWPDSKEQWLKVGPSFSYQVNPNASFEFSGLYTVMGKNTAQSIDIAARVTWGF